MICQVADFNLSRIMEDPKRTSSLAAMNPVRGRMLGDAAWCVDWAHRWAGRWAMRCRCCSGRTQEAPLAAASLAAQPATMTLCGSRC